MSKLYYHDHIMSVLRLSAFFDDLIPRQDHRATIDSLSQGCLIWHEGIIRILIWASGKEGAGIDQNGRHPVRKIVVLNT